MVQRQQPLTQRWSRQIIHYLEASVDAINQTIITISDLFLEIAKLQSQEELLDKNVKIGQERLEKVEDQFAFGKVTGLDVLRAKTDLNQDRSALDNILVVKNNLKRDLNFLIGLEAEMKYRVSVSYQPPQPLSIDALKSEVVVNNPEIQLRNSGVQAANKWLF
ncbi:TolC family protein [Fulvivirga sp. M361]|nr:TolC family protein [Fulvivirga sp. M361]